MHDAGAGAGCSASGTHHKVPEKETSRPVGVVVAAATSASEGPAAAAAVTLRA